MKLPSTELCKKTQAERRHKSTETVKMALRLLFNLQEETNYLVYFTNYLGKQSFPNYLGKLLII